MSLKGSMKFHCSYFSLTCRRWILFCQWFLTAFILLVPASHGQTTPADVPSGFMPGIISNYAGDGKGDLSFSDGSLPTQVVIAGYGVTATDSQGNVYIALQGNHSAIYMVYGGNGIPGALANVTTKATPQIIPQKGRIYQIASGQCNQGGTCGEDQPLNKVTFASIFGLAIDSHDNLYYSDYGVYGIYVDDVVRKVDYTTSTVTTVAGQIGVASSSSNIGDGNLATNATLNFPLDIKLDSYGNLYILDAINLVVRVVYMGSQAPPILAAENISVPSTPNNYIYTVAGQVQTYCSNEGCGDGGSALSAQIDTANMSIAVDAAGDIYIADTDYNNTNNYGISSGYIRVVYAGGAVPPLLNLYLNQNGGSSVAPTDGYIYPVTGYGANTQYENCAAAGCGDGGLAADVEFGTLNGSSQLYMTVDDLGNLYIADAGAFAVRKIDTSGYASTIAGIDDPNQTPPSTIPVAAGGPAVGTYLSFPEYLSFDKQNNLYLTDNELVWQVAPLLAQNISLPVFDPATVTYGVNSITLAATSDTTTPIQYSVSTSNPNGIGTINGSQLTVNGAGSITVTATQPQTDVYLAATASPQTLTVNKADTLVVTANDKPATPGSFDPSNPGFTFTVTGFVHGDTAATSGVYSGAPSFTTNPVVTDNKTCGTFSIIPSNANNTLSSTNYEFANFVPGTLSITGSATQTINFPAFSSAITYGQTTSVQLNASASSKGTVTYTVLSGPGTIASGSSTLNITGAGPIVVQAIQQGTCTYAASPAVTQTLTVNPAKLTVTGPTVTSTYGTVLDTNTFPAASITGFVSPDTQASVLTGKAGYTIPSTTPNAGTYAITVGLGTLQLGAGAAANYTFTYANGSLIVNQATQTINFNPIPSAQTYGNIIQMTAVAVTPVGTSNLPTGQPIIFTPSGPANLINGSNNTIVLNGACPTSTFCVTVTATQAGNGNYLPAPPVSQTIYVSQAPLDITAINMIREQGAPNPTFSYQVGTSTAGAVGGFVNNDTDIPSVVSGMPVLATTATQASTPGTYTIAVDTSTMYSANYKLVPVSGTLTVTQPGTYAITSTNPDGTVNSSANPLTIKRGLRGQLTITITPSYEYVGTITLSCAGPKGVDSNGVVDPLPANVTCTVSPSTYTFTGEYTSNGFVYPENPQQGTITINTTSATVVGSNARKSNVSLAGFLIPGAFAGLFLVFARKRVAKIATFWSLCALLSLGIGATLGLTSCGGSSINTTAAAGTQTITLTGTGTTPSGGTVTATVPLTVTIQ
jgi:hypothetical protein